MVPKRTRRTGAVAAAPMLQISEPFLQRHVHKLLRSCQPSMNGRVKQEVFRFLLLANETAGEQLIPSDSQRLCRQCYMHPAVLEGWTGASCQRKWRPLTRANGASKVLMTRKPECCTGLCSLPAKSPEFTEPKPSSCNAVHICEQARFRKIERFTARLETNTGTVGRLESLLTFELGYRSGD